MLLLPDENFPKRIVEMLRSSGSSVLWARTDCSGWEDAALIDFAESEARIVLTLDKDSWADRVHLEQSGVVEFIRQLPRISSRRGCICRNG
jgi:predicted nuclease of predicted toxin-antitoxin system